MTDKQNRPVNYPMLLATCESMGPNSHALRRISVRDVDGDAWVGGEYERHGFGEAGGVSQQGQTQNLELAEKIRAFMRDAAARTASNAPSDACHMIDEWMPQVPLLARVPLLERAEASPWPKRR